MRIVLVGSGAREHALAWKLSQSPNVESILVIPGNGGTASLPKVRNVDHAVDDYLSISLVAMDFKAHLVVVGPGSAVVDGIEAYFRSSPIACFAPTRKAAELEGSKAFAKNFMKRHKIPTAQYQNFTHLEAAKRYVREVGHRVVIKASGLAAGKGVILPSTADEAVKSVEDILGNRKFGDAGSSVVIEEYLEGQEISILTLSDGKHMWSFPAGQDHKRAYDGDKGLNTGGMGVYAPVPFVTTAIMKHIEKTILEPTFNGLHAEGRPFQGCLFTGIMLTTTGPKVLEYNVRFGDPETQNMLLLLDDETDLAEVLLACTNGTLDKVHIGIKPNAFACNVVVAAGGYPEAYESGDEILFGYTPANTHIFHAGTKLRDGSLTSAGGRVLSVAAVRDSLPAAVEAAYAGVKSVHFRDMHYRKDIAQRGLTCKP